MAPLRPCDKMPASDILNVVEGLATFVWIYAALVFAAWGVRVARLDRGDHIPHMVDLLGRLVPTMIVLVGVVMIGAFVGLPSVVVVISVLFPAGLAIGAHGALYDLQGQEGDVNMRGMALRLGLTAGLGTLVIYVRQIA